MIIEGGYCFAWPVPRLTDADLEWMDRETAMETIMAHYQDWEDSRSAVDEMKPQSLAARLTLKAKGVTA